MMKYELDDENIFDSLDDENSNIDSIQEKRIEDPFNINPLFHDFYERHDDHSTPEEIILKPPTTIFLTTLSSEYLVCVGSLQESFVEST